LWPNAHGLQNQRTCGTAQPGSKSLRSTASSTGNSPAGVGSGQQLADQGVGHGGGAAGHAPLGEDVLDVVLGCRPAGPGRSPLARGEAVGPAGVSFTLPTGSYCRVHV